MTSGKHIADEGSEDKEEEKEDSRGSESFTRAAIAGIVKATEDMGIDYEEEERGTIGMRIAKYSPIVDITEDMLNTGKG